LCKEVECLDDIIGSGAWMMSWRSNKMERGQTKWRSAGGLEHLPFGFGFERSKAWAGYDGPLAVIFILVGHFAMKMGYPILLVLDSSPQAFRGISFILPEA
jgi:hypothetical protein